MLPHGRAAIWGSSSRAQIHLQPLKQHYVKRMRDCGWKSDKASADPAWEVKKEGDAECPRSLGVERAPYVKRTVDCASIERANQAFACWWKGLSAPLSEV